MGGWARFPTLILRAASPSPHSSQWWFPCKEQARSATPPVLLLAEMNHCFQSWEDACIKQGHYSTFICCLIIGLVMRFFFLLASEKWTVILLLCNLFPSPSTPSQDSHGHWSHSFVGSRIRGIQFALPSTPHIYLLPTFALDKNLGG